MIWRPRKQSDFRAELRTHLQLEADRLEEQGMSADEARHAARRAFGNVFQAEERFYQSGRWQWWDGLRQDMRYGLRMLGKNRGFTALAVLTLGLGIGANATIFSWTHSTLLDPIPGASATGELVAMSRGGTVEEPRDFSYLDYLDLRTSSHAFSGLIASDVRPMNLTGTGKPHRVWGTLASANYFDVLRVRPRLGRGFMASEDQSLGSAPVVVLSYSLWRERFGRDAGAIGRVLDIDHHPFTVIGVAPPDFVGSRTGLASDLWVPVTMQRQLLSGSDRLTDRGDTWLKLQGRLAPGVSRAQAQQEMHLAMDRIADLYPDSHRVQNDLQIYPLWRAPGGANAYFYVLLPILMAIAGVVLMLACANVANLLLVRSFARRREIAIRLSMGAGRLRVVRQLLVESLLLALAGGGLALAITSWAAGMFAKFIPATNLPISFNINVDRTVLLATLAVSILTALVTGIIPALRASALAPVEVLKEESLSMSGGRRKTRLAGTLVVAQIALSLLLLVSAGLFVRAFRRAQHVDPGFKPDNVLLASYDLFPEGMSTVQGRAFHRQVLAKLRELPGVGAATLADEVPLGLIRNTETVGPEGYVPQAHESIEIRGGTVGPDYLRTMGIPLVEGRDFSVEDTNTSERVAIVNQALADRYWPHSEALGKTIEAASQRFTVVGVARTANYDRLNEPPQPYLYIPLAQNYTHRVMVEVRTNGDPLSLAPAVAAAIHELDPDLVLYDVEPLSSMVELATTHQRMAGAFVGIFGVLALILASVGIYGVIAYTTRQRTHEIGIRLALGAQRRDVVRLILAGGLRLALSGVALGIILSVLCTRWLRSELLGVAATDLATFASVVGLLVAVALAACYIPARRAAQADPMSAVRF